MVGESWEWHHHQRWNYRETVPMRIAEAARIYNTPSPQEALDIMRKYGVEYVYLGKVERLYYAPPGIAKFDTGLDGALEQVYENCDARIFSCAGVMGDVPTLLPQLPDNVS